VISNDDKKNECSYRYGKSTNNYWWKKMSIMTKDPKRRKQLTWSREFREYTQHMSIVPRPQAVRTTWLKNKNSEEEEK
jgi:hypothetical protein